MVLNSHYDSYFPSLRTFSHPFDLLTIGGSGRPNVLKDVLYLGSLTDFNCSDLQPVGATCPFIDLEWS